MDVSFLVQTVLGHKQYSPDLLVFIPRQGLGH